MHVSLDMMRAFRAVAGSGGLKGAAESLGRTPSAVSMALAKLEAEVGGALFETERKSRLTPLGHLVLEESERATDAFARAKEAIRRHARSTAGTVRIATVPSAAITLLPDIVRAFRASHPDVRLEISDAGSAEVRRRVEGDEADIGILSAAPGEADGDDGLLLRDEIGIVCRRDGAVSTAARSGGVSWDMLALEPLIANPLASLLDHPAAEGIADAALDVRNVSTLLAFVRAGLGISILPRTVLAGADDLAFIQPTDPPAYRELRRIARADLSPVAADFWASLAVTGGEIA